MQAVAELAELGRRLLDSGRPDEAAAVFQQALSIHVRAPELWFLLGHAHARCGARDQAVQAFSEVVKLSPDHREAMFAYAVSLREAGHPKEALETFGILTKRHPDWAVGHVELGALLFQTGRPGEAETAYLAALALAPEDEGARFNLAQLYRSVGEMDKAERELRELLFHHPNHAAAQATLGAVLSKQGRLGDARETVEGALADGLAGAELHTIHGNILRDLGELNGAEFAYRAALAADPGFKAARTNLIYAMAYHALGLDSDRLGEMARYEQDLLAAAGPVTPAEPRSPDPNRKLRIGFIGGGFNDSIIAPVMAPLLEALDRDQVETVCYAADVRVDAVTERMQAASDYWRSISAVDDRTAAAHIRRDGIDVLIDVSGHTAGNRLGVFVHRPAPVQITWLHAMSTMGFSCIDHILLDGDLLPADSPEPLVENRLELASFFSPYRPVTPMPEPKMRKPDAPLTFGSFNNLWKINEKVIRLWAEIMSELPEARLMVKARQLGDKSVRDRLSARFSAFGIAPARLDLYGHVPMEKHWELFGEVDIALDSFPFSGGRTTTEMLYMGVPVVALDGKRITERLSAAHLRAAGLGAWVAATRDDYVDKALAWARAPQRREKLRRDLRRVVQRSDLGDFNTLARSMEQACRIAWRRRIR